MFTLKIFTPEKYKCEYRANQSVDSVIVSQFGSAALETVLSTKSYSFPLFNMMLKKLFWNNYMAELGIMASWHHGTWHHGFMASWHHGFMASWPSLDHIFTQTIFSLSPVSSLAGYHVMYVGNMWVGIFDCELRVNMGISE